MLNSLFVALNIFQIENQMFCTNVRTSKCQKLENWSPYAGMKHFYSLRLDAFWTLETTYSHLQRAVK